jgi:hypothetical protein
MKEWKAGRRDDLSYTRILINFTFQLIIEKEPQLGPVRN